MVITSRTNPTVVRVAALKEKKYREEQGLFLLEGVKLFREAISAGVVLESVFAVRERLPLCEGVLPAEKLTEVSPEVMDKLSTERSPEGIVCAARYLRELHRFDAVYRAADFSDGRRILLLSQMRDPGNLGAVIRSAAAFGTDELILSSDSADLYNPKTVRAAMGTLFRQKITYVSSLPDTVRAMREAGYRVCSALLDKNAERLDRMKIDRKTAFVIGNEGHGVDPAVTAAAGNTVFIPMKEGVESLNASAAAAVFMWQSAVAVASEKNSGEALDKKGGAP